MGAMFNGICSLLGRYILSNTAKAMCKNNGYLKHFQALKKYCLGFYIALVFSQGRIQATSKFDSEIVVKNLSSLIEPCFSVHFDSCKQGEISPLP